MCVYVPDKVDPDLFTLLVTTTPMYEGTPLVGGGLLPPVVVHGLLQPSAGVIVGKVTVPRKPLNAGGAEPPVRTFRCHHASLHQVTVGYGYGGADVTSPSANAPRLGKANTIAVVLSLAAW